jgi:dihydrofolate reductase
VHLHLIFARSKSGVIGVDGGLPWHLSEDLAHFKRTTLGCPVIMGRKTWDSLPVRFRPLPGRANVVVTRQKDWQASGALKAESLHEAMALCGEAPDVWVIGGAQLYALALPLAHSAVVTEIDVDVAGDAFAPLFGPQWQETAREEHVAANGLPYRFITLQQNTGNLKDV